MKFTVPRPAPAGDRTGHRPPPSRSGVSVLLACNGVVACNVVEEAYLLSGDLLVVVLALISLRYLGYRRAGAGLWLSPVFYTYVLISLLYSLYLSTSLTTLSDPAWLLGSTLSWGAAAAGGIALGWLVGGEVSLRRRAGEPPYYRGGRFLVVIQEVLLLPQLFVAAVDLSVVLAHFPSGPSPSLSLTLGLVELFSGAFFMADAFFSIVWPARVSRRAHPTAPA